MSVTPVPRPQPDEYAPALESYFARVPGTDVLDFLARQVEETSSLLLAQPPERGTYRYAPGKWSVTEVVGHMTDAERIFGYRALRIARGDATPLEGFDENAYVPAGKFDDRGLAAVLADFRLVRQGTLALFRSFDEDAWARRGVANGKTISVRALAYLIAGHEAHHVAVLRERYGLG